TRDDGVAGASSTTSTTAAVVPASAPVVLDESQSRIPVGDSPVRGPSDALVTIVEIAEFQCPFSRRVQESLDRLRAQYPADVRIAFKHNPLSHHTRAMPASELALEAFAQQGPDGFWRAHDHLFARQMALEPMDLEAHALALGLDLARVRSALSYGTHRGRIERDRALARELDATGTPTLFVNGRRISGAQPYEDIQRVVAEELVRARATLAGGVPRGKLYGVLSATVAPDERARSRTGFDLPGLAGGLGLGNNEDDTRVYNIPVASTAPWRGAANAPVVIQMYGDYECPFTKRSLDTIQRIEQEYRGRVRVVWRNQPLSFHPNATAAALAAHDVYVQAGPEAFWRYHALLFENQRSLSTEMIVALAVQVPGVDSNRVRTAILMQTHRLAIGADTDSLVLAGVRPATPIFFVNGRMLRGAQPIERFRALVDQAIGR
ncbi:MAG: thioredoxin domain-containing protein, partial [Deltaproteobacteria bacterium]|nr:thioredoxin domain-containing protein [Deltaproteobacteria bacterium]